MLTCKHVRQRMLRYKHTSQLLLTCKNASQLMSQSYDRRLGLIEKAGLGFHLMICKSCQAADRQLIFLHQLCKQISAKRNDISSLQPGLSAEAQQRILKELRRKQGEQSTSGD